MELNSSREYAIKVMLDDITFMLFDLDLGGFVEYDTTVAIDDQFSFSYRRELVEEVIVNGYKNIISNFFVEASKDGRRFLKFETRGAERKFTIFHIDGFLTSIFVDKLDQFRVAKFDK